VIFRFLVLFPVSRSAFENLPKHNSSGDPEKEISSNIEEIRGSICWGF
jgi:hypothetical protein